MSERLPSIRADKFLPLVPQLAVRLSSKCDADSSFQNILMKVGCSTELIFCIVGFKIFIVFSYFLYIIH